MTAVAGGGTRCGEGHGAKGHGKSLESVPSRGQGEGGERGRGQRTNDEWCGEIRFMCGTLANVLANVLYNIILHKGRANPCLQRLWSL